MYSPHESKAEEGPHDEEENNLINHWGQEISPIGSHTNLDRDSEGHPLGKADGVGIGEQIFHLTSENQIGS